MPVMAVAVVEDSIEAQLKPQHKRQLGQRLWAAAGALSSRLPLVLVITVQAHVLGPAIARPQQGVEHSVLVVGIRAHSCDDALSRCSCALYQTRILRMQLRIY